MTEELLGGQVTVELLGALLEQPFYAELRTRQQLGYIVYAGTSLNSDGAASLNLVVQSVRRDPKP